MKGLKFYRYCHAKQEIDRVFTADLQSSRKSVGEKQKRAMDLVTAAVSSFGIWCLIQKKKREKNQLTEHILDASIYKSPHERRSCREKIKKTS